MKNVLLFLFLFICLDVFAPVREEVLYLPQGEAINAFDSLIEAVAIVESNGNTLAYNKKEQAVGAFQIRQCRVTHYNKLTGKNYKLKDMYDYEIAKEVFVYFACMYFDYETIARRWNGSGPMTTIYWNKVKKLL